MDEQPASGRDDALCRNQPEGTQTACTLPQAQVKTRRNPGVLCCGHGVQAVLGALRPTSNPDASWILDGYRLFGNVWSRLDNGEKRNILGTMFDSLFFDREGRLVRAVAYEPFRELLGLPEDRMIAEL